MSLPNPNVFLSSAGIVILPLLSILRTKHRLVLLLLFVNSFTSHYCHQLQSLRSLFKSDVGKLILFIDNKGRCGDSNPVQQIAAISLVELSFKERSPQSVMLAIDTTPAMRLQLPPLSSFVTGMKQGIYDSCSSCLRMAVCRLLFTRLAIL